MRQAAGYRQTVLHLDSCLLPPASVFRQAVAHTGDGEDERGAARIDLDFFAQAANVDVDVAITIEIGLVAPNRVYDLRARQRLPGVLREIVEEPELDRGEGNRLVTAPYLCARPIDDQVPHVDHVGISRGEITIRAAMHRPQSRDDFAQTVGLGHIIVRAHFQPQHFVGLIATSGQHHDRLTQSQFAQAAAEVEAQAVGQPHIEDDQVGRMDLRGLNSGRACVVPRDGKARIDQTVAQAVRNGRIIFDE